MSAPALLALAGAPVELQPIWAALAGLALLALLASTKIVRALAARASTDVHIRGTRVRAAAALRGRRSRLSDAARALPSPTHLCLGGIRISAADETRHFKIIGTTGTGKSTAISALLRSALARGDRAVIADPNGACLIRFFDRYRGDVLLNPFEPRSARWDLFGELRSPFDAENLARGLVPECDDPAGREWRAYARTLVGAVVRRLSQSGPPDLHELWRLLALAGTAELRSVVAGTPGQAFLDEDNARMFSSIRSVTMTALAAFPHLAAVRGTTLSIRDWIVRGRGVLFMPYRADQIAALRALISTWMRLAIFQTLSGEETAAVERSAQSGAWHRLAMPVRSRTLEGRRIWFIVDELDALGTIDGLTDALSRLRKFGGCCVLGLQSLAQVSTTYGAGGARSVIENCGNTLILRCSASESGGTAAFASQLIGEREVLRRQTARSSDRGELFARRGRRRSTQIARQRVIEPAVLPSEIEQLPDLVGYLKTASNPCWTRIRLAPESRSWPSTTFG